jgi:predicted porin
MMGMGAYYRTGKLNLAAAYQSSKERTGTGANLAVDDQTEMGFGGRYDFGWVLVNAGWYKIDQVTPAASRTDKALLSDNTTSYWLGAVFPVGKSGKLGVQMGETKGDLKVAGLPQPKGTTMAAYYTHSINKDASVYINYGQVNNNAGSALSLISANYAARLRPDIKGSDPRALAVGIIYTF